MANTRAQRKANRAKLNNELWDQLYKSLEEANYKTRTAWNIFCSKYLDGARFKQDEVYRQELLALKRDFKHIMKEAASGQD